MLDKTRIIERHYPDAAHYKHSFFVWDERLHEEMRLWCTEQFGPGPNDMGKIAPWMSFEKNIIAFADLDLAFAFKMRWL